MPHILIVENYLGFHQLFKACWGCLCCQISKQFHLNICFQEMRLISICQLVLPVGYTRFHTPVRKPGAPMEVCPSGRHHIYPPCLSSFWMSPFFLLAPIGAFSAGHHMAFFCIFFNLLNATLCIMSLYLLNRIKASRLEPTQLLGLDADLYW